MAEQNWDSAGNIYYTEGGVPVDGVIDPETGLFIPGITSVEDLKGAPRDPFTDKPYTAFKLENIVSRIGMVIAKVFQYLWHALLIVNPKFWMPIFGQWLTTSWSFWKSRIIAGGKTIADNMKDETIFSADVKAQLKQMLESGDPASILNAIFLMIPWYSSYATSFMGVVNKDASRDLMTKFTPTLLDAPLYINMLFRQPALENELNKYMAWLGLSKNQIETLRETLKPLLSTNELAQLRWRDIISEGEFKSNAKKFGYTDDEVDKLYDLVWMIPPPTDLVRFAVREAFSPDIINKYELESDFPPDFAKYASKVGISEEWARRYWYAHWELPSIEMGFEMLHRGIIKKDDMDILLRTKDVMPYWRDKITGISYRPYSRVDVRRMYAMGVISKEEVKRAYLDLGYDIEKAAKMTEFTVKYTEGKEKDLSKSELLDGMINNLISESDVFNELMKIGYSHIEAAFLIDRAKLKKSQKQKEMSLGNVKRLYISGIYDATRAVEQMAKLDIQSIEMEDLLNLWNIEKQTSYKLLPEPKLQQLLQQKIIDASQWVAEMKRLNYPDYIIYWLFILYTGEPLSKSGIQL